MSYFITHDRGSVREERINKFIQGECRLRGKRQKAFRDDKKGATSLRIAANIKLGL